MAVMARKKGGGVQLITCKKSSPLLRQNEFKLNSDDKTCFFSFFLFPFFALHSSLPRLGAASQSSLALSLAICIVTVPSFCELLPFTRTPIALNLNLIIFQIGYCRSRCVAVVSNRIILV